MYVESLHHDRWVEGNDIGSTATGDLLSRNAVREALGRLDVLAVGDSAIAEMVVYATFENETFYQLTNPEAREDEIFEVVAGGQVGDYPACLVVGLSSALKPPKRLQEEVLYPPS